MAIVLSFIKAMALQVCRLSEPVLWKYTGLMLVLKTESRSGIQGLDICSTAL